MLAVLCCSAIYILATVLQIVKEKSHTQPVQCKEVKDSESECKTVQGSSNTRHSNGEHKLSACSTYFLFQE